VRFLTDTITTKCGPLHVMCSDVTDVLKKHGTSSDHAMFYIKKMFRLMALVREEVQALLTGKFNGDFFPELVLNHKHYFHVYQSTEVLTLCSIPGLLYLHENKIKVCFYHLLLGFVLIASRVNSY